MKPASQAIMTLIEESLTQALQDLSENKVSKPEDIQKLCENLRGISESLKLHGISQESGVDSELRPAYVIMQGIIETAITHAINDGAIDTATMCSITPRMPTPLMLSESKSLSEIDIANPLAFAEYRHNTLLEFLKANGQMNSIYCHDAKTSLSVTDSAGLSNYERCVEGYENLKDYPAISIDMKSLPQQYTGAIYIIDGAPVTIQSMQVTQIDNANPQVWAIKFDDNASSRVGEIYGFLQDNGVLVDVLNLDS